MARRFIDAELVKKLLWTGLSLDTEEDKKFVCKCIDDLIPSADVIEKKEFEKYLRSEERLLNSLTRENVRDVRENKEGHWVRIYKGNYKCSNCGDWWGWDGDSENEMILDFKYCPTCGSRMKGIKDE